MRWHFPPLRFPGFDAFQLPRTVGPRWEAHLTFKDRHGPGYIRRNGSFAGPRTFKEAKRKAMWLLSGDTPTMDLVRIVVKRRRGWQRSRESTVKLRFRWLPAIQALKAQENPARRI